MSAAGAASQLALDRVLGYRPCWTAQKKYHGGLTVDVADRCATRLGLHPCDVWGDAWWEATAPTGVGAGYVCPDCWRVFDDDDDLDGHGCESWAA